MFDIKWIRDNAALFDAGRAKRGLPPLSVELLALDDTRRAAIAKLQTIQERRNAASKEIGAAMGRKDAATAERLKAEVNDLKAAFSASEVAEKDAVAKLDKALGEIPNHPANDVPVGADEHSNVEHHRHGTPPALAFKPKEHFDIGEALGLMDFEAAAKMSGARFVVLKGALARLERALMAFMLDMHTAPAKGDLFGYTEVAPPLLVKDEALFGTNQLPKFREDQFSGWNEALLREREDKARRKFQDEQFAKEAARAMFLGQPPDPADISAAASILFAEEQTGAFWLIPPPKSRSPTSCARASSRRNPYQCASPPERRASAPKPVPQAATRAA